MLWSNTQNYTVAKIMSVFLEATLLVHIILNAQLCCLCTWFVNIWICTSVIISIHILLVHLVGMTCGVQLVYIQSIFLTSNFPQANVISCFLAIYLKDEIVSNLSIWWHIDLWFTYHSNWVFKETKLYHILFYCTGFSVMPLMVWSLQNVIWSIDDKFLIKLFAMLWTWDCGTHLVDSANSPP